MYRKHNGLVPKPNYECIQCSYTCSTKQVFAMHMHKQHDEIAPDQMYCDACSFTSYLPSKVKNHFKRNLKIVTNLHWWPNDQMLLSICLLCLANDIEFFLVIKKYSLACLNINVDFKYRCSFHIGSLLNYDLEIYLFWFAFQELVVSSSKDWPWRLEIDFEFVDWIFFLCLLALQVFPISLSLWI